ncbi:integrase [Vreelandella aquamarina]|jgi:integrase|uniref:Phage integrase family protein n=1 Tax=Vreelandella aquamarina TaxID=77097 RepID=A0A1N6CSB2_9GAMM|nr:site-specific integrase [Halomonas meridiana]GED46818.1 integrase [Halomonas meridiana]SIN61375.1 Phage integrase family protein [Halomonas meridiana]SIN66664.1 Phage integrase family protein [Halomonas meridiana]SIN97828.1 Phage integrase family protein [Halomonas meridiana]|tara:strand:- start:2022 stop:3611 length:1590 start_codon:yes stop_codon:yes gene_type:complete
MSIAVSALEAPTHESLDEWLSTPRLAKCGEFFTPSEPLWWPDRSVRQGVNWEAAILCVPPDWQRWLQAALAYRMTEVAQGTIGQVTSVLSRAARADLEPLNMDHLIDLRERFNVGEFSSLVGFMEFWQACESLEKRPSQALLDTYKALPRKKRAKNDVVLRLDPEEGPFTRVEQDALFQWMHDQFCHKNLDPEHYLYLRLAMIYGLRGCQLRELVFKDFIKSDHGYKIRVFWAKQRGGDAGWRAKSEIFNLDEDLYNTVQAYKSIVLAGLEAEYPERANWYKAINNVPLFRRRLVGQRRGKESVPVIVDLPDLRLLEQEPKLQFHVSDGVIRTWLYRIENMPGFPISPRTQQPLKISKGHRFRHTLGTDLSNAGLDEWSIASAFMHANTHSVRKYRAVSPELMKLIDEKMSDHLALVVGAFTGTIVTDRTSAKNGGRVDRQIEDLAVCGADTACYLDAPFTCYGCSKFQPLFDADHKAALVRLERRREQTIAIDKTTGVLWDRAILACRKVILDCNALRESGSTAGWEA